MSDLSRWACPPDTGAFRFGPDPEESAPMASLRLVSDGGMLRDAQGRAFCTPEELHRARDTSWRGLPCIVVSRAVQAPDTEPWDTPRFAVWTDARGIETPERFRARLLGAPVRR